MNAIGDFVRLYKTNVFVIKDSPHAI